MNQEKSFGFRRLSWDDLEDWAGSRIVDRGRRYHRAGAVGNVRLTTSGGVIASVEGTDLYATHVGFDVNDELVSACSCPYDDTCKHAVAVVLEVLEILGKGSAVSAAQDDDWRWQKLGGNGDRQLEGLEGVEGRPADGVGSGDEGAASEANAQRTYLEELSKAELIAMLEQLAGCVPEVREGIEHRRVMSRGDSGELVGSVRRRIEGIRDAAEEPDAWYEDEGLDYGALEHELTALLELGRYEDLMSLGEDLLGAGGVRVEASHDGMMAWEIGRCLGVAQAAAARSSLSVAEKMKWFLDMEFADDYGILGEHEFWDQQENQGDWSLFADLLLGRLEATGLDVGREEFSTNYDRDRLCTRAIEALERAGRDGEIISLCEREARFAGSYLRLVERLEQAGRLEEAEAWIREGFEAESENGRQQARRLREKLVTLREASGDWLEMVAIRADEFFSRPELSTYRELLRAASGAGSVDAVRVAALHFLETGTKPRVGDEGWPFPVSPVKYPVSRWGRDFPDVATLLEVALHEKRADDVLHWYGTRRKGSFGVGWGRGRHEEVAFAVKGSHPDVALEIWKHLADGLIAQTGVNKYRAAGAYLRKVRKLLEERGRVEEWNGYITQLRRQHPRKRRFLEILDGLVGRPIIGG